MNYREFNLINTLLVATPGTRYPPLFSPRDEIADPKKLKTFIDSDRIVWNGTYTDNQGVEFLYANVQWIKNYTDDIYSTNFYIMTKHASMFQNIKNIDGNKESNIDWTLWLRIWGRYLFLITTPIFEYQGQRYISKYTYPESHINIDTTYYGIRVDHGRHINLHDDEMTEVNTLLQNRCYTIGNGFTLMLAMYRNGMVREIDMINALQDSYSRDYYQDVYYEWESLYYGVTIPHIADYPWFYGSGGLSVRVFSMLLPENNNIQCMIQINNTIIVHTIQSALFKNFNLYMWKCNEEVNKWAIGYYNLMNDALLIADIPGFIQCILKNKSTWKWWKNNYVDYLNRLSNNYNDILLYIFYRYSVHKRGHRRLRQLYLQLLDIHDANFTLIKVYLLKHLLKKRINSLLFNTYLHYTFIPIPCTFYVDILALYNTKLELFNRYLYLPFATPIRLLLALDTNLRWADVSLYKFVKMEPVISGVINKKILYKLCTIYRMFGIGISSSTCTDRNCENTLNINSKTAHTVGILLLEYLKNNKEHLEYLLF